MRRALLGLITALGITLSSALPVTAAVGVPIRIDCNDGDSWSLTVDLDTLTALTSSVQAINEHPTGLTCSLSQLSTPLPFLRFGSVAAAAQSSGYVIGGGTVIAGCPPDWSTQMTAYFSVKMYVQNGVVRGSANLRVPAGQCVGASTLTSKQTCLTIIPTTIGGGRAWANSFVTQTTGPYFAPHLGKTIGWAFEDNGPNGGTLQKDRFRVVERPGSCPMPGDPISDYYVLDSGDVTVRP
jgi:hypothetical protein